MNKIEEILRKKTVNLFSDDWYLKTSEEIMNSKSLYSGYIYFIKDKYSKEIKIGKTININKRMNQYRTYSANGIFIIGVIYSEKINELEKEIHLKYSVDRLKGEWFNVDIDNIKNFIIEKGGELIGGVWHRDTYELSGYFFNISKSYVKSDASYYDSFYEKLRNIELNKRYSKTNIYKEFIAIDDKYKNISKKKVVDIIRGYCVNNNLYFEQGNTNGTRWFSMNKK